MSIFKPALGLKNRHIQTLYATFFRKQRQPDTEIEVFELDDGDFVECFWHNKPDQNSMTPIVVLFHGLEGSHKSPYIQGMMHAFKKVEFSTVIMHFRGCSGKTNRLARSYHSGETGDARAWIESLVKRYPNSSLFAIGYSMGGNMLLKLLGEWGESSPLKGAASISAPILLSNSAETINRGFARIYQKHLLKHLRASLLEKYRDHPMYSLIGLHKNDVKNIDSIYAFDDVYTAKIHGFGTAKEYYRRSSAKQYLKQIQTPTLIIHALDDPFMTKEILPQADEISSSVKLEVYENGGHVGFVSGTLLKPRYWLEDRIVNYFMKK